MSSLYKQVINGQGGSAVCATAGTVDKVIVNSHSTGTFRLFDGLTDGSTPITGTYTPATGSSVIEVNAKFDTGLYVTTTGQANLTILINGDPIR
jgi:hypothetical protein